ncbi:MAG TPA: polysaccharide deacetylase family protein [Pirellulales bacterium]|jgi:hypothetical protein|nr:polysaccharide deacetylase family protein [Pirellulales bacterium]
MPHLSTANSHRKQLRRAQLGELRNRIIARGLGVLPPRWRGNSGAAFGILMYHRVAEICKGIAAPTWNVTPPSFQAQLIGLLERGFRPCSLQKAFEKHVAGQPLPDKTFVVTFDDVYENVYRNAFPILRELRIPATMFVATAYLDSQLPLPFDDWSYAGSAAVPPETWKPITTSACAEMLASGLVELGSHTHTHADFRGRVENFCNDLKTSLEILRAKFGITQAPLALPFGNGCRLKDGPELSAAAEACGVRCVVTTNSEVIRPIDDPLNWGRFAALDTDSAASLAAKLDGRYSVARSSWSGLRRWANRIFPTGEKMSTDSVLRPKNRTAETTA